MTLLPPSRVELGKPSKVLMLVKTYPIPSTTYGETVCCAGLDAETRAWVRMYPVNFRSLEQFQKFSKWQFIEATWSPARGDGRPESRRVHQETITLGASLPAGKRGWPKRREWLDPLVDPSIEYLIDEQKRIGRSLGVIRPAVIEGLEIRSARGWDEASLTNVNQLSMSLSGGAKPLRPLEVIPFDFLYRFKCSDDRCRGHLMEIFDWEAAQAFRNFRRDYGTGWEEKFRQTWEQELPARDLHFVMGTHHTRQVWMIVGVLYPPRPEVAEREPSLGKGGREDPAVTMPLFGLEAE